MIISNAWRRHGAAELDMLADELIDVSACTTALKAFTPAETVFYSEMGLPCIDVVFQELVSPTTAIEVGKTLEDALCSAVYFSSLTPHRVQYLVESCLLLRPGQTYALGCFEGARIAWDALEQTWLGLNAKSPAG